MRPTPIDQLRFRFGHHSSALWWLGLLYRKPMDFKQALDQLKWSQSLAAGIILYLHALPHLLVFTVFLNFLLIGFFRFGFQGDRWIGFPQLLFSQMLPVLEGMAVGIAFWIAFGGIGTLAVGIALGIVVGVAGWIAYGIAHGIIVGVAIGIVLGIAALIAYETIVGITFGVGAARAFGIVFGMAFGIIYGITGWINYGITYGVAVGVAGGITCIICMLRAYYHPFHLLFLWPALRVSWYRYHPVAWDDLCSLPFPDLDRLLVANAKHDPSNGHIEITRLMERYPSQRNAAMRAQAILVARKAGRERRLDRLGSILADLPEGDDGFLAWTSRVRIPVEEICQLQLRLDSMDRPFLREPVAALQSEKLKNFQSVIPSFPEPLATEFRQAASCWTNVAQEQHRNVLAILQKQPTPQVFRAGPPVDRTREAFIPREIVLGELDRQLSLSNGCPGLILYGRQRTGKSTLMKNLDGFLSTSIQILTFSMENPDAFTSQGTFLRYIMESLITLWPEVSPRAIDLPTLQDFSKLMDWCNKRLEAEGKRLLLAFDEYENIDEKLGEGVFSTDLLSTLRESIQYHRCVTWLFSGSHSIEELTNAPWPFYLVSARTLEVPPFSEAETRRLLTEPLLYSGLWEQADPRRPRFNAAFWGDRGIERIHSEAAGWPHLVQLLAETAVSLCNNRGQERVDDKLLADSIAKAIGDGDTVLRQLLRPQRTNQDEQNYLQGFRRCQTQSPPKDEAVYQGLRRRMLVEETANGEWRLRVPLMQRWLRERG